jgi:hypothetical protein
MELIRAIWELLIAISAAIIGGVEVVIRQLAQPVLGLATNIQKLANSLRQSAEELKRDLEKNYPKENQDPVINGAALGIIGCLFFFICVCCTFAFVLVRLLNGTG